MSNPVRIRVLGIALVLGVISYLVSSPVFGYIDLQVGRWLSLPADAIPPLLFFFTWALFEDDRNPPSFTWLIAAIYLAIAIGIGSGRLVTDATLSRYLLVPVQLTKLAFAGGAMYVVWRGRENDVVESRLKLRRVFAASIGIIVAAVVATELVTGWNVPESVELVGMAAIFAVTLIINLAFLRLNPTFVLRDSHPLTPVTPTFVLRDSRPLASVTPEDAPIVEALEKVMAENRAFTNHDLRIADLAARLKVPEYQLRRTINRNLGYRNFNQFINHYRVAEAARRLVDEPRVPVLTIALDVGFRSVSSFNTAFRSQYGQTPTDYRKGRLADS